MHGKTVNKNKEMVNVKLRKVTTSGDRDEGSCIWGRHIGDFKIIDNFQLSWVLGKEVIILLLFFKHIHELYSGM